MKKIILGVFTLLLAVLLVACGGKETTGQGFGLVHKAYVGEATVTVKKGKVTDVKFEEYFLLSKLGEVEEKEADNVLKVGSKYYAKFMLVDGKLWTAEVVNDAVVYKNNNVDIVEHVKDGANAQAYVKALKDGKVFIVDAADATVKSTVLTNKGFAGIDKRTANYWPETHAVGIGWKANMAAMEEAFVKYGVDAEFTKGESFWQQGDNVTGATLSDFADYQVVAKRAVANAK